MSSPPPLPRRWSLLLVPLRVSGPLVPSLLSAKATPLAATNDTAMNTASVAAIEDNGRTVLRICLHLFLLARVQRNHLIDAHAGGARDAGANPAGGNRRCTRPSSRPPTCPSPTRVRRSLPPGN